MISGVVRETCSSPNPLDNIQAQPMQPAEYMVFETRRAHVERAGGVTTGPAASGLLRWPPCRRDGGTRPPPPPLASARLVWEAQKGRQVDLPQRPEGCAPQIGLVPCSLRHQSTGARTSQKRWSTGPFVAREVSTLAWSGCRASARDTCRRHRPGAAPANPSSTCRCREPAHGRG